MTLDDLDRLDGLESDLVECAIELRNAIKLLEMEEWIRLDLMRGRRSGHSHNMVIKWDDNVMFSSSAGIALAEHRKATAIYNLLEAADKLEKARGANGEPER